MSRSLRSCQAWEEPDARAGHPPASPRSPRCPWLSCPWLPRPGGAAQHPAAPGLGSSAQRALTRRVPVCVCFRAHSVHARRTEVMAALFSLGIQHPQVPGAPPRTPSSIPCRPHPSAGGSLAPPALLRASSRGPHAPDPQAPGSAPSRDSASLHPAHFIASGRRFGDVRTERFIALQPGAHEIAEQALPGGARPSAELVAPCVIYFPRKPGSAAASGVQSPCLLPAPPAGLRHGTGGRCSPRCRCWGNGARAAAPSLADRRHRQPEQGSERGEGEKER